MKKILKCCLPTITMRFNPMAELKKHVQVCYFMDVSNQKSERIKIVVEGNPQISRSMFAREVTNFCLTASGDFKIERFLLPQIEAILN